MAITQSQVKNSASVVQIAVGSYIQSGTAAAFDITTGFKPLYVKVVNETDRTQIEWYNGMADSEGIVTVAAGTRTLVTSNGIIQLSYGFTFGLDTDVNVSAKQLSWLAQG